MQLHSVCICCCGFTFVCRSARQATQLCVECVLGLLVAPDVYCIPFPWPHLVLNMPLYDLWRAHAALEAQYWCKTVKVASQRDGSVGWLVFVCLVCWHSCLGGGKGFVGKSTCITFDIVLVVIHIHDCIKMQILTGVGFTKHRLPVILVAVVDYCWCGDMLCNLGKKTMVQIPLPNWCVS